jgi:hypothetical protein
MKKNYFTIILFSFALFFSSSAQITIMSNDMPSSNDTFRVSMGIAFTGMNEAATGTNYSWDYSQLTASSQTIDTFVSVLSTGLYYIYFGSNSTYGRKSNTPSIPAGTFTLDYEYDFFKKASSGYVSTGGGVSLSGFPLGLVNTPGDTLYRFPLNYNNTGNCSSSFGASVPTIGFYGGQRTRIDTVDGWGSLTTPYGTFNALRVKSTIYETDSLYLESILFGFPIPRAEAIEYKWLANGKGIPLLQINTSGGFVTQIIYRDSIRLNPVGIKDIGNKTSSFNVYPNPASDKIVVEYDLERQAKVSSDIYNLSGEKIFSTLPETKQPGKQFLPVDLSGTTISSGIYLLKLNIDGRSFEKSIVIKGLER